MAITLNSVSESVKNTNSASGFLTTTILSTADNFVRTLGQELITGENQINGLPIFDLIPDTASTVLGARQNVNSFQGQNNSYIEFLAVPLRTLKMKWVFHTATELNKFLRFFGQRYGSKEEFYIPSFIPEIDIPSVTEFNGNLELDLSSTAFFDKSVPEAIWIANLDTGKIFISSFAYEIVDSTIKISLKRLPDFSSTNLKSGFCYRCRFEKDQLSIKFSQDISSVETSFIEIAPATYTANFVDKIVDDKINRNSVTGSYGDVLNIVNISENLSIENSAFGDNFNTGQEGVTETFSATNSISGSLHQVTTTNTFTENYSNVNSIFGSYVDCVITNIEEEFTQNVNSVSGAYESV